MNRFDRQVFAVEIERTDYRPLSLEQIRRLGALLGQIQPAAGVWIARSGTPALAEIARLQVAVWGRDAVDAASTLEPYLSQLGRQVRTSLSIAYFTRKAATVPPKMAEWFGIAIVPNDSELIEVLKPSASR